MTCTVRTLGKGRASAARLKGSMRLVGSKARTTRSGRGSVKLKLRSQRRLKRSARAVVQVRSGKATARLNVRPGRAAKKALSAPAKH